MTKTGVMCFSKIVKVNYSFYLSSFPRSVNNEDLEKFAENCLLLEQLDILGTGYVDYYSVEM